MKTQKELSDREILAYSIMGIAILVAIGITIQVTVKDNMERINLAQNKTITSAIQNATFTTLYQVGYTQTVSGNIILLNSTGGIYIKNIEQICGGMK